MSSEEVLRENEVRALENNQIVSRVSGKLPTKKSRKWLSWSATGLIVGMVGLAALLMGSGNMIPSAISERLIEETDVQYADAVESKKIVFQQALFNGEIPEDTAALLKENGYLVGYSENGEFIESNKAPGELVLKHDDAIITASDFINEVGRNLSLYNAFNNATYSRAAYYFDDEAEKVFREIGTNRNNYTENSDFDEVMNKKLGKGSNISVNTVGMVEKEENGEKTYEYTELGGAARSNNAAGFVSAVGDKNKGSSVEEATLNSADTLKVADTVAKEQRSSLFFLVFMENISKMKAGDGNSSKINEAMNYLYEEKESEVVDVKTGEVIKTTGTPLDAPSLYAVLSGSKINAGEVENYSADRVIKTIENQVGGTASTAISGTVASTDDKTKGAIGRFINSGEAGAAGEILSKVEPTINSSLVNNSYETIVGINAGEFLVEGAVNVGKRLAKASGAAAGDAAAVTAYLKINNEILAMDAKIDRMNRSPFDITSKNTFLGSIVYNIATIMARSKMSGLKTIARLTSNSLTSLLPGVYADATEGYLATFGDCETIGIIGAVGSAQCSEVATFDTSTLNNPFGDAGFISFVEANTTLNSSGERTIIKNSTLANYILYNDQRKTPIGVMDGGILDSLTSGASTIPFVSGILSLIKKFLGTSESEKRVASGAAFVNSSSNPDWQVYKYAQRYVSLARATAALKKYTSNAAAYNNLKYFEGVENPVAKFLDSFYASNDNLVVTEVSN